MADVVFQGWKKEFRIRSADVERICTKVRRTISTRKCTLDDGITAQEGDSLVQVVFGLREARFTIPSKSIDQEKMLEALGFQVVDGRVAQWGAGGKQIFGKRCRVVIPK
jgi:hypothetical protein